MSGESSGAGLDATLRDFSSGQKVFNRYTLIRTLGRGGMGIVWLAHDEVLDRDVALKFLPEIIIQDRAVLEDLKRETKRSLELTHKNIVRIHDFMHDVVSACISMEYIEGDTLSNLRADKPAKIFEPDEIKPWLSQLCDALDYAHNHARIIHRDLKPSNLMISRRGHVKVADFGIARSLSDSVSMLTHARGTSGTLLYMSPQQLDGERGTPLDDIYSLGATIYELLTSRPPFFSGNIDRQIHEKVPPSMTERRKELEIEGEPIDQRWEALVARCLRKDPARRPQSIADVGRELDLSNHQIESARTTRQSTRGGEKIAETALGKVALGIIAGVTLFGFYFAATRHDSKDRQPLAPQPNKLAVETQSPAPAETASKQVAAEPTQTVATTAQAAAPSSAEGSIWVSTEPAGAMAILDGSTTLTTPATFSHLPFGKHYLQIIRNGYFSEERQIDLTSSVAMTGKITLKPRSDSYDGVWVGKAEGFDWTSVITIKDGNRVTCTQENRRRLPKNSSGWTNVPPPDNKATLVWRWTAESRSVIVAESSVTIYWNDWKFDWEPSTLPRAVVEKAKIASNGNTGSSWLLTLKGKELTGGTWKYRRKP